MYYRSQGYRYPRDMRVPINYSGNAFLESKSNNEDKEPIELAASSAPQNDAEQETEHHESSPDLLTEAESENKPEASVPTSIFKGFGSNSLFGGRIGSEELLILALVFLLSDTDTDSDIIWLLLLLLFIK